jgi:sensor histidine kinase regulating citrate/malate metabolism
MSSVAKISVFVTFSTSDINMYLIDIIILNLLPVISTVFFFYFTNLIKKRQRLELKAEFTEQLMAEQSQHLGDIITQSIAIEKLKHDFNSHTLTLNELAYEGKYDDLKSYLSEFTAEYSLDALMFCTRGAVNAVLSRGYRQAKAMNVDIQILWDTDGADEVSDIDLCKIISNLMKNAVEACEDLGGDNEYKRKRFIKLSAGRKADCYVIVQRNISNKPNPDFATTKDSPRNHGIGLEIITDTAKKYGGDAVFEYEDGIFTSTVMVKSPE